MDATIAAPPLTSAKNRSTRRLLALLAGLVLFIFAFGFVPAAKAQSTGDVSGTVVDPSGAIVANATVAIKNTETNAARTGSSNSSGIYNFTNLQPGTYTLTTTVPGFAPYSANLQMTVGGHVTLDAKLALSSSTTAVEVQAAEGVEVNTATPEMSQVITPEQVSQLPSLTRNPYDFVALSGNISSGDNTASGTVQNGANRGVDFSLNGQRNSGTEILLDGVENVTVFADAAGITVPIDAVQEYRIITNNFAPEYGRASGGVVAVATKSGANTLHGTVWEFNRISATAANTVTNAQTGVAKGIFTRNQFGGEVGGPIVKDKLFFMGAAEFTRVRSAAPSIAVIPTSQFLAAAAPSIQSYFSTYGQNQTGTVIATTTNVQAGTALSGSGTATSLYPTLPANLPVFNVVSFLSPTDAGGGLPQNTYNIVGRVDFSASQKTQAFFRYVDYHELDQQGAAFASPYAQYDVAESNLASAYLLSVAHEFTTNFSALTKLSFSRFNASNSYNSSLQNTPTLVVSPNASDPYSKKPFQLPGFYDTNPANGGLPYGGPQDTSQINEDLNWSKGRHEIQGGAQLIYIQDNNAYGAYAQANEQLGSKAPQGYANFLTGNLFEFEAAVNPAGKFPCVADQYSGATTITPACSITLPASAPSFARSDRFRDWAVYAQDQFKVSPKLTLDYGVRYEYFGVQHNDNPNLDSNFYYGSGSSLPQSIRNGSVQTVPNSPIKSLWNPQHGTVSPRLGFAVDVFGNGMTSVRGGYGISYERNFGNVTFNLIQNPPNYAVIVLTSSGSNQYSVTNSNAGPLAGASGTVPLPPTSLRAVDPNIRTAQTQFHSLSIDQQFGHSTVMEISYNGARGIHLYDIKNYNGLGSGNQLLGDPVLDPAKRLDPSFTVPQVYSALTRLNPQYSNINNRGSNGDSYYNALNVKLETHDIHHSGLSLVANYTLSHALDDLSTTFSETSVGNFALGYTDPFNPSLDHGDSDFDIRHRFVVAPIYRTPWFSKGTNAWAQLLGGYEFTGIYTARTGTPFTYYDSTNDVSGYNTPRYNPVTPVTNHLFKSIPNGAQNTGNSYQLTSGSGQTAGAALPADNPFDNPVFANYVVPDPKTGRPVHQAVSDWGPYPSTMTSRNSFRGPGAYNLNVSVSKTFPIHERLNFELRAEGFNVTNHHNLYIQQSLTDAATYPTPQIFASKGGVTGGANDERRFLQFAGKVNF